MSDLREALRRTSSKPLRGALERTQQRADQGRRIPPSPLVWQGPWDRQQRYTAGDVVEDEGSSWRCLIAHTDVKPPPLPAEASAVWELVARKGEQGAPGPRGFVGPQGPAGQGSEMDIEDEGIAQGVATTLDFVGAGVVATVAGSTATITIPGGGTFAIPQLDADPVAPTPEDAWVLRTGMGGGGEVKFLFGGGTPITSSGASMYEFSYRTLQNTTVRVALT